MKFAIVVVLLVLAASAQSSILPLAAYGGAPWGSVNAWGGAGHWAAAPWAAYPAHVSPWGWAGGPGHYAASSAVHVGHGAALGHEGVYTAANRGSVHVAPLPGHIHSASSINVAPAPGTNW